jgi:biopolymer transport protein TolR
MSFFPPPKPGSSIYRPMADINVTPLVDVMLVLLIIFMVTAPMLATGLKVNLPQAKQAVPLSPNDPIVLTIGKDGRLSLGSDDIARDRLIDAIRARLDGDNSRVIHLRGDQEAPFGDVVTVMDLLAANGLTHIAIVAQAGSSVTTSAPAASPGNPAGSGVSSAPISATVRPGPDHR